MALSLEVTKEHAVSIACPAGGTIVVLNASGDTLFYADNPQVSATNNQGSLTATSSQTFTTRTSIVSASRTDVQVTYGAGIGSTAPTYIVNLEVTADHVQPVGAAGCSTTVQNVSGGTLFYADNRQVSPTNNQGSLTAGNSQSFSQPTWICSTSLVTVQVTVAPKGAWGFSRALTIDHTKVGGTLSNYVLSLDLSADSDVNTNALPNLADIRVTDANGIAVPYEVETQGGTEIYVDASWVWFGGPKALCYRGTHNKVYMGIVTGGGGSVAALSYDVDTKTEVTGSLHSAFTTPPDDHNTPGLFVKPADGHIMAFYANADTGDGKLYQRTSTNVEDVSAWGTETTTQVLGVSSILEYPQPHFMSSEGSGSGRLYMIFNDRSGTGGLSYITSDNLGTTWSGVTSIVNTGLPNIAYVQICNNNVDRIDIAFTDNPPLAPGTNGQQIISSNNLYHCFIKGGNLYRADGTVISTLAALGSSGLTPTQFTTAGARIAAYNGSVGAFWAWDMAYDANNNPQIVYATYPGAGGNTDWTNQQYRWVGWNGSSWVFNFITAAGNWMAPNPSPGGTFNWAYSGGITLLGGQAPTAYLSREVPKQGCYDSFEIEKWAQSGSTWNRIAQVSPGARRKNTRPYVPQFRSVLTTTPPEVCFMSGGYTNYQNESQSMLVYPAPSGTTVKKSLRIQVPSVNSTTNTTLFVYYGNPAAVDKSSTVYGSAVQAVQAPAVRSSPSNIYDHAPALNMTGWTSWTVAIRANLAVAGNDGVADFLYSNEDQSGTRITPQIRCWVQSGVPSCDFLVFNAGNTIVGGNFPDKTGLHDGNSHAYAFTWDGTTLKCYVDGVVSSTTYTSPVHNMSGTGNSSQGATLGWSPNVSTRRVFGTIFDFYISNQVESLAWIQTQQNAGNNLATLGTSTAGSYSLS